MTPEDLVAAGVLPPPSFVPEDEDAEGKSLGLVVLLLLVLDTYYCHCLTK